MCRRFCFLLCIMEGCQVLRGWFHSIMQFGLVVVGSFSFLGCRRGTHQCRLVKNVTWCNDFWLFLVNVVFMEFHSEVGDASSVGVG